MEDLREAENVGKIASGGAKPGLRSWLQENPDIQGHNRQITYFSFYGNLYNDTYRIINQVT